ncbi:MAG: hypothetical protein ACE5D0_03425 [Fidelibacterota bacterium]
MIKNGKIIRLKRVRKGIYGLWAKIAYGYPIYFDRSKKMLIDRLFELTDGDIKTIADLGGIYKIHGAYSFYTIQKHNVDKVIQVDTELTQEYLDLSKNNSKITSLELNFTDANAISKIVNVDAIYLFDVLLHQVDPDWDEVLELYSHKTKYFVIFNQMFNKTDKTIRLLDLGFDEYFQHVPFEREHPLSQHLINKTYKINAEHGKIWRDVHHVFQWGITVKDLIDKMEKMNFELLYRKFHGKFSYSDSFDDYAFIFQKNSK